MIEKLYYGRKDGKENISIYEVENRCCKYARNIVWGLGEIMTLDMLKRWLDADMSLREYPEDSILEEWLKKWTPGYLAEWSYRNDHNQTKKDN